MVIMREVSAQDSPRDFTPETLGYVPSDGDPMGAFETKNGSKRPAVVPPLVLPSMVPDKEAKAAALLFRESTERHAR